MNYKVTRIGLLNFWYFDDEVFNFFDGKLLLRGENGSGKSVTMQSFIPLILDGNRMPSRLDPFGTKEKKIEDYLLGPSDGEQKDDSIGYLYMETYNEEKDKYITIGIGLYARKGRPTDFWGFAIKDGRRIGIDIQLYKSYSSKILMTKKELKVNLGTDNDFVETAKEYKALVNDLLFGFDDIEQYDEFINVLLQLRSSKLSKEYNPTKLMNILSSVLQPLTDDDIRPLSEAIEDTNKTREKVEQLSSSLKDLANLSKTYNNYNETILYNKAKSYKETKKSIKDINKTIDDTSNQISKIKNRLDEIESNLGNLDIESTEIETKLASIDNTELKDYTEQLNDLKVKIEDIECAINNLKSKIENKNDKINKYTEMINDKEKEIFDKEKEILSDKNEIVLITDELNLLDIKHSINDKEINFTYLEERINKYKNKLKEILAKLEEVEKLKDKINDKEVENEEISKNLKDKEKDKEEQLKLKYEEIDKFKDELNLLYKMNIIDFSLEKKKIIFDLIDDYSTFNYGKAKDEYQKEIKFYEMSTINEIEKVKNKIENESKELDNVNKELDELKNKKEIEYVEEEITKYSENVLNELNIPFTYLYKVIEFKDNILEDEKDKIEELLISMNILNAKLVPSKYLNDVNGIKSIFLKKGKYKDNNLTKYFNVLDNSIINKNEINDILSSISIDSSSDFYITPEKYEYDFLIGYPSSQYKSKFIGIMKRQEEHKRQIELKEKEKETKEKIINNYQNILNSIQNKLNELNKLSESFPENINLENLTKYIDKLNDSIDMLYEKSKNISNSINEFNNKIRLIMEEINKIKDDVNIPLTPNNFKSSIELVNELLEYTKKLKNNIKDLDSYNEEKNEYKDILDDGLEDKDNLNNELYDNEKTCIEFKTKKKTIEEILDNPEFKKIVKDLEYLNERKKNIPNEKIKLVEEKGRKSNELDNLQLTLKNNNDKLIKEKLILELKENILNNEYKLGYVYQDELNVDKILNELKDRDNSDPNKVVKNYMDGYNIYRQSLLDYRLSTKTIFDNDDNLFNEYINKGLEKDDIKGIIDGMSRYDLETLYQGRKLNIHELAKSLRDAKYESENYISNQERRLFEEILLTSIGIKIRDKIESSKEWVKRINEIMKQTQIDSNLSFELEWKGKTAFSEDEIDTKELVRLFKIDPGTIKEDEKEKLSHHFMSQINKEIELNDKVNENYSDIIFKVLDYRNWFEFKLYYKRKVGEKKELTNKVFSILSGGERAKSMYVPLFASVYAKLLNARSDSLRLIALDEAFAGVDNNNIREMFDILSQLNLDYILTSQALWGDYETIKELSICELIKDEIHKAVGVRHYRWNGKSKEILEKRDLYE